MSLENAPESRAIVALFHKSLGKRIELFSLVVVTRKPEYVMRKTYDVDYSRRYGYLYHQSGAGGCGEIPVEGIYYTAGDVAVKEQPSTLVGKRLRKVNRTRRLKRLPIAFSEAANGDLLEWLHHNGIEQDAVYCSECNDHFPSDELCKHCWWCEEIGWYSTPSEPCKCRKRGSLVCSPTWHAYPV